MTRLQYWAGWIAFWATALALVRWFIVNPILNRLDALIALGQWAKDVLQYRVH